MQREIGSNQCARTADDEQDRPVERKPGQKKLSRPNHRYYNGHPDIGLQKQEADNGAECGNGYQIAVLYVTGPCRCEQPGGYHREGGVLKIDGWTEIGPRPIQRRAPLISAILATNVATTSREKNCKGDHRRPETPVGESSDAPIIRASATGR